MKAARSLACLSVAALLVRFAAGCSNTPGVAALPEDGGPDATEDSGEPGDTSTPEDQTTGDAGSDQATGPEASGHDGAADSSTQDSQSAVDSAVASEAGPEGSTVNEASTPDAGGKDSAAEDSAAADSATIEASTDASEDSSPGSDAAITDGGAEAESGGATQQILLLGVTGAGAVTGDVFDGTTWGAPSTVTGTATADDLSLAVVPATGHGLGLLHGTSSALVTTAWNGSTWSALAQLNSDTTQGRPTLAASGSSAFAVYWGTDFKYYFESYAAGAWSSAPQAVIPSGAAQPCGPSPAVLAPLGASASLLFVNGSCSGTTNHLYDSDLVSGAWQASTDVASNPSYGNTQRPAVVAPTSGPELVAVFIQQGSSQLVSASRTSGTWGAPANITNALTNVPVALAPLAGGGVLLAFQGTDSKLYTATYSGGSWSSPAAAFSPDVSVATTPALATGIGTAAAEMAYVDTTGALFHTRLTGTTWSTPTAVASGTTGFSHVAIASGP
jgi:hypothetical protein